MAAILSVEQVTRTFGGLVALDDVSLAVDQGQIAGLIGPNGAGKTTAFNVITRLYKPDAGRVVFDGHDLLRKRAHKVVGLGIARTFQNVVLFPNMTVLENVLVGAHSRRARLLGARGDEGRARDARLPRPRPRTRRGPPPGSPSGRSSGSSSRARSSRGRGCCCSTSRPAGSTTRRSRSSAG